MRLSSLIASNEILKYEGDDVEIAGITADSRNVGRGFLFVAIPGTKHDGRNFIAEAIARGAIAVLTPTDTKIETPICQVTTTDLRQAVSLIASRFYPLQPEKITAVTGTSGKTSTAQFTRELWEALGLRSASVGTLGYVSSNENHYGLLTTPDAITLHGLLDASARKGITHLVLEASSHGLALNRLDSVRIEAAAFTNLTRDHLDYHETMENYLAAKMRLFAEILIPSGTAVINADSEAYSHVQEIIQRRGLKVISYGYKAKDIRLLRATPYAEGQHLTFEAFGKIYDASLPVIGAFQAWNALCALGLIIACGGQLEATIRSFSQLSGVPGRLQFVGHSKAGGKVFVDYAHKPDALENVLKALRPHVASQPGARLGIIFGCGGNRDRGKRPIMGGIAQRLADWVIVTDDNPRHEEPRVIRSEILAGCEAATSLREIGDRAEAIAMGISSLRKNDVLVIAGKGHETGQIIGDKVFNFDDTDVARKALES